MNANEDKIQKYF